MSASEIHARRSTALWIACASSLLYVSTLFPGVGGVLNRGDSAKFQFLGFVPGVGHPPGNPAYLALLALVQRIPLGTPALRANLFSAVCAVAAVTLIADATYRLSGRRAAWVSGGLLALGGLYWEFATEAEVYSLAGLFVALSVHALARAETEARRESVGTAFAAFMLGVSNHLSLVVAFPALCFAGYTLFRRGISPTRRGVLLTVGCGVLSLALYAGLPWLHEHSAYTEYAVPPTFMGFLDFVTGAQFRAHMGLPSLEAALYARPTFVVSVLLRQWPLLIWLALPLAFYPFLRKAPAVAGFAAIAASAWLLFMFIYAIPDPDGLMVPIACVVAPAIGMGIESAKHPRWLTALVGAVMLPAVVFHLHEVRNAVSYDVLEDVTGDPGFEVLDLPDIIARIPEGALLTLPCAHYGCAQTVNYYRFADARTRDKNIEIVALAGGKQPTAPSVPRIVAPATAAQQVVCTIDPGERTWFTGLGAEMRTVERGAALIRGKELLRMPLWCSVVRSQAAP